MEPRLPAARTPSDFLSAMHQALVECVTLQNAGLNLDLATTGGDRSWNRELLDLIAKTEFTVDGSQVKIAYPADTTDTRLARHLDGSEGAHEERSARAERFYEVKNKNFLDLQLDFKDELTLFVSFPNTTGPLPVPPLTNSPV